MSILDRFLKKKRTLAAFADGSLIKSETINDKTFSEGILGKTVGIIPARGLLSAPADGKVMDIFHTKHALTFKTSWGAEIILHIGINTVALNGKHFTVLVSAGQSVHTGDSLISFDLEEIKKEGYDTTVVMAITNSEDFSDIILSPCGLVKIGDEMMTV